MIVLAECRRPIVRMGAADGICLVRPGTSDGASCHVLRGAKGRWFLVGAGLQFDEKERIYYFPLDLGACCFEETESRGKLARLRLYLPPPIEKTISRCRASDRKD